MPNVKAGRIRCAIPLPVKRPVRQKPVVTVSPRPRGENLKVDGKDHDEQDPREKGGHGDVDKGTGYDESVPEGIGLQRYQDAQPHTRHKGDEDR